MARRVLKDQEWEASGDLKQAWNTRVLYKDAMIVEYPFEIEMKLTVSFVCSESHD
jgi:hypothetical protein